MSKKTLIIIIIGLLLVGVGIWYFMTAGSRVNPTTGEREGGLSNVFPIGDDVPPGTTTPPSQQGVDGTENGSPTAGADDNLTKLTEEPVVGAIITPANDGVVRYVSRGQGHIREINADGSGDSILLNETVTRIQEAQWSRSGNAVILQRLAQNNTIETQYLALVDSDGNEAARVQISDSVISYALSPSGNQIAILTPTENGSQLIIRTPRDGTRELIAETPLRDLTVEWPTSSLLTLTTKATQEMNGYMYTVPVSGGRLTKELGAIPGLTTNTSPDGSAILYSTSEQGTPFMNIWHRDRSAKEETGLPVIPSEKCTWANNDIAYCAVPINTRWFHLDWWLQGRFSFVDMIWRFDTSAKESELIVDLSSVGEGWIDAVDLSVDQDETVIVFKDRQNGHLWSYPLEVTSTNTGTSSDAQ